MNYSLRARFISFFVSGVVFAAVFGVASLVPTSGTAQSRSDDIERKPRVVGAEKRWPPARAINSEQMQNLLKRDGNRPLLVNYWATWCDLCREEFPDLVKIDNEYKDKGLEFIAITLDDLADMNTEVPKFLRKMKATMPVYLLNVADPDPAIHAVDPSWSGALPATFLYNNKGEVVYKQLGRIKPDELRTAIDKLVSSKQ